MKGTCTNDKGISAFFTNVRGTFTNVGWGISAILMWEGHLPMLGDIRYTHVRGICINDRGTSAILI